MLNTLFYHTFCPFRAYLGESPGSPLRPWVSKKNIYFYDNTGNSNSPIDTAFEQAHGWVCFMFLKESNEFIVLMGDSAYCIYTNMQALRRPTQFTPSQREVMGSDHIHSSAFSGSGNQSFLGQHPITMANHHAAQYSNVRGLDQCFPVVSGNCRGSDTLSVRNRSFVSQLHLLSMPTRLHQN